MGHTPTASTLDEQFAPRAILRAWYDEFPKAREHLHDLIKPWAYQIVEDESDRPIKARELQVKIKSLTLKDIQQLLQPEMILAKYRELAQWHHSPGISSIPFPHLQTSIGSEGERVPRRQPKGKMMTGMMIPILQTMNLKKYGQNLNQRQKVFVAILTSYVARIIRWFKHLTKAQAILMAITMLVFVRNQATNVLPLIIGLFLKVNGTSSRAMTMLSNIGICVSGRTVERLKKSVSDDAIAHAIELVTSGHLFCTIFDNINIYLRKFQQRITNQNQMIHATNSAILAIDEEGLDVAQVEKLNTKLKHRGRRAQASFEDIIPTVDDNNHIERAFTCIIAEMLIRYTPESDGWKGRSEMAAKVRKMMPSD